MPGVLDHETVDRVLDAEFDRTKFVKGTGALVVGFTVAGGLLAGQAKGAGARVAAGPPDPNQVDSWVTIHEDNTATIAFGKIDITGTPTALLMIAAEELDLPFANVKAVRADTDLVPNQGGTWGSNGTSGGGPQVRQAAAEARQALLGLASKQFGVPVANLQVAKGVISVKSDPSKTVTYGALLGGKRFLVPNTGKAPLKDVADYKLVGKSVKRIDTPAKVAGTFLYAHNVRLPGMLHARVVRPLGQGPYTEAVKPLRVNEASIKNIKGARVVRKGDFIAVVANTEQDAIQAATQLKVTWSEAKTMPTNGNLFGYMRQAANAERVALNKGNVDAGLKQAVKTVEASYGVAYQSHASFGPSAAVADVKGDRATVMVASQNIYGTRNAVAQLLGLKPEQVRCQFFEGAGCYGKNLQEDPAQAAAVISQLVGKPVRVQMTRQDEHGWDFYGPAVLADIRGGVDANGHIVAYDYVSFQQGWASVETTSETLGTAIPRTAFGGADRENAGSQYDIKNHRILGKSVPVGAALPRTAYLRAPAAPQALFASEQMIDELAYAAGMDPVEFRRKNIENERWLRVLNEAAKAANWKPGTAAANVSKDRKVRGRGVAIGGFASTQVATIADIEVDRVTGKIRVLHVTTAQDCGLVVNRNTVLQQMEGCVVQGVSRALIEEVKFSKSRVTSLDWESYPILRFKDVPEMTNVVVNRPEYRSSGAGEPATAPVAAAIANAFFDATGKRIRQMPMTPGRVRSALKG